MLSVFPELLNYQLLAVFILRAVLGALFVKYGVIKIARRQEKSWKAIGLLEVICGLMLVAGLFTQIASLLIFIMMAGAVAIKIKTKDAVLKSSYDFYVLLLLVSFSLLFLGPGIFSFDLPL